MNKGDQKNKPHQVILNLYLRALNFNCIVTVNFLEINPTVSKYLVELKIGPDARSWDAKTINGLHKLKWAPHYWIALAVTRGRTFPLIGNLLFSHYVAHVPRILFP